MISTAPYWTLCRSQWYSSSFWLAVTLSSIFSRQSTESVLHRRKRHALLFLQGVLFFFNFLFWWAKVTYFSECGLGSWHIIVVIWITQALASKTNWILVKWDSNYLKRLTEWNHHFSRISLLSKIMRSNKN